MIFTGWWMSLGLFLGGGWIMGWCLLHQQPTEWGKQCKEEGNVHIRHKRISCTSMKFGEKMEQL
eukprot:5202548-Ditylum_brightwellii.AAC.1